MKIKDALIAHYKKQESNPEDKTKINALQAKILSSIPPKTESPLLKPKRLHTWFVPAISFAVAALLIGATIAGYVSFKPKSKPSPITKNGKPSPTPTTSSPKQIPPPVKKPETNITLASGFKFYLPPTWSSSISDQSKSHFSGRFFIPGESRETEYVEIESISTSEAKENPLLTSLGEEKKTINGLSAHVLKAQESFQNSKRDVEQVTVTSSSQSIILTLYGRSANAQSEFDSLVVSVQKSEQITKKTPFFIKPAYAADAIRGIPLDQYKGIDVMGDPLPERITAKDYAYKDGYAKFYKFDAFKGQRLTTVAMEDKSTNSGSFIRSELYNEQGEPATDNPSHQFANTRIEFEAPYTGTYYYVVRTFNNQEGGYLLKVFDRNQTENLLYLKHSDGSEIQIDRSKSPPIYGAQQTAFVLQFISPIELVDNSVRYFAKPQEFEPGPGLVTSPIEIYMKEGSYYTWEQTNYYLPENHTEDKVQVKITQISPSKILIEQASGELFPINYHIAIKELFYTRFRIFTEEAH